MKDKKPIIKATTPRSKIFDTKIDVYTDDPRGDHESIHIVIDSDTKTGHIIDTTNGETEHTDIACYLTTACMRYFQDNFNDNCYELKVLRWFRDNFVSKEDIKHYYQIAPVIVDTINNDTEPNLIYDYVYDNIVDYCVEQIELGNYEEAYNRYKNSVIVLENEYTKKKLGERLVKILKR